MVRFRHFADLPECRRHRPIVLHGELPVRSLFGPTPRRPPGPSASRIDLAWTDNSSNETGFIIERASSSNFAGAVLVTTTAANATAYSDTGLTANTTYYYRVRAT